MVDINDFSQEVSCEYSGETYSVRDNGAIMRLQRPSKPIRKKDNVWTFGDPGHNGYVYFCGVPVHRIVCKAFNGDAPSDQHVVDHIDTNRQNNRPDNLRWLTKLENILNNEITRSRVEYVCGSIEAFLKNPSLLFGRERLDSNFKWMRAVSKEEALNSLQNIKSWLKTKKTVEIPSSGHGYGDWIFDEQPSISSLSTGKNEQPQPVRNQERLPGEITWDELRSMVPALSEPQAEKAEPIEEPEIKNEQEEVDFPAYKDSLTLGALQSMAWRTPTEFPLCPQNIEGGLDSYLEKLVPGAIVTSNIYCKAVVLKAAKGIHSDIVVMCEMQDSVKPFSITIIHIENGKFAHDSYRTFFCFDGAEKYFTLLQGKVWTGGDVFDDCC